nr:transcript-binding protein {N-terminal} [Pisum sativum=peas, Arkel, buds, Peptide Chloroplast Partial, 15 aa] [Pisum sativum]
MNHINGTINKVEANL